MNNTLKAYTFNSPEYIPISLNLSHSVYQYNDPERVQDEMLRHKRLFPGYVKKPYTEPVHAPYRRKGRYIDSWGVEWETAENGITGAAVRHPLSDMSKIYDFAPPSAAEHNGWEPVDWKAVIKNIKANKESGCMTHMSLRHGFMFLTLTYLRGFEDFMCDLYDETPEIWRLIEIVEKFNADYLELCLILSPDIMGFPEDLGAQANSILSPEFFRKFIKPSYKRLMGRAKSAGALIHMHSDGYILNLTDDLIDCGVDVINLQDLINGIDNIKKQLQGRVAVDLDIDRQNITVFGTPKDIDGHIREIVEKLGDKRGGLSLRADLYGNIPFGNIKALMDTLEKYSEIKH